MKLTTACSLAILSSAAAFSPNSMLSKSAVFANSATTASTSLSRPMVASQEVEVNNVVNNGQRKKTKEVSSRKQTAQRFTYIYFSHHTHSCPSFTQLNSTGTSPTRIQRTHRTRNRTLHPPRIRRSPRKARRTRSRMERRSPRNLLHRCRIRSRRPIHLQPFRGVLRSSQCERGCGEGH